MVADAISKAGNEIDWSQYDWDGDDFVDQLMIIYAGKGQNDDGGSNTIWPHQLWLSLHSNLETEDPTDYRSFRDVTSGEKVYHVDCYCCIQELSSQSETNSPFGTRYVSTMETARSTTSNTATSMKVFFEMLISVPFVCVSSTLRTSYVNRIVIM